MASLHNVRFPASRGRSMRAALALPDPAPDAASDAPPAAAPKAALVVLHEALGLNDDIRRIAGRFADQGYVTLAPDFLDTGGPRIACMTRFMLGVGGDPQTSRPYRDLDAARHWLAERDDVDAHRIGVVGFCVGGGFALTYAAQAPLQVVAPFYATLPRDETALDRVCPVVASYGARDRVFGRNELRLRERLEQTGISADVWSYPDAGHSFMNRHGRVLTAIERRMPTHGGYHEASAEDAWRRMLAFFEVHLAP